MPQFVILPNKNACSPFQIVVIGMQSQSSNVLPAQNNKKQQALTRCVYIWFISLADIFFFSIAVRCLFVYDIESTDWKVFQFQILCQ